jgi:peroxiredoxin
MSIITELFDDVKFILNYRIQKMAEQKEVDRLAPRAGDLAPDFTLTDSSGEETVTLSDFRGKKPVALVFGSFT